MTEQERRAQSDELMATIDEQILTIGGLQEEVERLTDEVESKQATLDGLKADYHKLRMHMRVIQQGIQDALE